MIKSTDSGQPLGHLFKKPAQLCAEGLHTAKEDSKVICRYGRKVSQGLTGHASYFAVAMWPNSFRKRADGL
jgi:hypothetical protein